MRSQVVELERQIAVYDDSVRRGENPSEETVVAERKVRDLESKLNDTSSELKSISQDRNRLLDLSNKLRVDLLKASPKKEERGVGREGERGGGVYSNSVNDPASRQLAEALRRTEESISSKYEAKISSIEDSLQKLSAHNANVRGELDKWGSPSTAHMHIPSSRAEPLQMPSGVAWENEDQNVRLQDARRALLKAKEDLAGAIPGRGGGGGVGGGEWGEFAGGRPLGMGVAGGDGGGLEEWRRPPAARAGMGAISSRATDSQREAKERLARTQRRRLELMGERRKARNWNVTGDEGGGEEGEEEDGLG